MMIVDKAQALPRVLRFRARALLRRKEADAEMDEELRFHLEMATQAYIDAGMTPEEARYAALRKFGSVVKIKETAREEWGVRWLEDFLQDLRHGCRLLLKNFAFTIVTVLTLALGIDARATY